MNEPAQPTRHTHAVCPRIERSETRRPKLFESFSAAEEFLRAEVQFPLDDKELEAEFSRSAKQEYIGGINEFLRVRGTGFTIKDVRRRKPSVEQQAGEPLLNNTQGWQDPVPVSRAAQYAGPKCSRTLREFLPLAEVGSMPRRNSEDETRRALEGRWTGYACYLSEDWRFDDIETDARRRTGHEYAGRRHNSISRIVLGAAYDLEEALRKFHPKAPCAAVADFWRSWQVQSHIAYFCWELGDSDPVRLLVGARAAEEAERARVHIWRQIVAFAYGLIGNVPAGMEPETPTAQEMPHAEVQKRGGRPKLFVDGERIKELRGERSQPVFAKACKISVDALQNAEVRGRSSMLTIRKIAGKAKREGHPIKATDLTKNPPQ